MKGWKEISISMPDCIVITVSIIMRCGAVGGVVNALLSDNGFVRPSEETSRYVVIIRPGFAGNILLGAVSALISWGLYGAFSHVVGGADGFGKERISITISSIAGAILIGIDRARWQTNEVDKKLLRNAAVTTAASNASLGSSRKNSNSNSAPRPFQIARKMYQQ